MIRFARLQHVRSYTDGSFEFNPGVNIVVGPNASGKTTIIEALTLVLGGKSFKARDAEIVQQSAEWARIDVGTAESMRVCKLEHGLDTVAKTFEIDGSVLKRLAHPRTIPSVLFEPNHLLLLHGSPELRRTFIDDLISSIRPGYDAMRRHYKRVLAQRNALLKLHKTPPADQLFVWNVRLSELGGALVQERQTIIDRFNERIGTLYSTIAGVETPVTLLYTSKLPLEGYETQLLRALERSIGQDIQRGFTSFGPHRDDVEISINYQRANESASRGEIRTLLLALKMLEAEFVEQARGSKPVLLFDDVFSELDGKRRHALVRFLEPYQAFITTTDADVVIDHFSTETTVISTLSN